MVVHARVKGLARLAGIDIVTMSAFDPIDDIPFEPETLVTLGIEYLFDHFPRAVFRCRGFAAQLLRELAGSKYRLILVG